MRQTSTVLYLSVDALVPLRGRPIAGLDEFTAAMEHDGIPIVWISNRNRFQLDQAVRTQGHAHPFIAEGACGVYLPEGYFNVRPSRTVRFGRFTCIPVAQQQPATAEVLETVSEDTEIPIVPVRSLSPRELSQNSGLPTAEAELARHRDFDELFFFAGASEPDIERFQTAAREKRLQLRTAGNFWSAALGASLPGCLRELNGLYQRALHHRPYLVAVATEDLAGELFPLCDQRILLVGRQGERRSGLANASHLPLSDPNLWEALRSSIGRKA